MSKFEALLDVLEREEHDLEAQLASGDRAVREKSEIIQRTRETIIATEERIRSLGEQRERATQERERLLAEKEETSARLVTIAASLEEATQTRGTIEAEMREKEQIKNQADAVLRERRAELAKARDEVYSLLNHRNQRSNELERRRARANEIDRRLAHIEAEQSGLADKRRNLEAQQSDLKMQFETAAAAVAVAEQEYQAAQDRKEQLRRELDEKQNLSFSIQGEIGKKISKIEFFTEPCRARHRRRRSNGYLACGVRLVVSRAGDCCRRFTTDAAYRPAFESVLGEIAYYLCVPTSKDAFEAVEVLRHSQKGKATLVALNKVPKQQRTIRAMSARRFPSRSTMRSTTTF